MSLARSATAFGCLALGLADLLYLNLAMLPAVLEEVPDAAAGPATAIHADATETISVAAIDVPEPAPPPLAPPPLGPSPARAEAGRARVSRPWSIVVRFARDRDELTDRARASLDRAAARLAADPSATAQIEGHADRGGDRDHNLGLSLRRAERVADHFAALGIDRGRLIVRAAGESRPLERDAAPGRRDRRVEVRVVPGHAVPRPEEDAR